MQLLRTLFASAVLISVLTYSRIIRQLLNVFHRYHIHFHSKNSVTKQHYQSYTTLQSVVFH